VPWEELKEDLRQRVSPHHDENAAGQQEDEGTEPGQPSEAEGKFTAEQVSFVGCMPTSTSFTISMQAIGQAGEPH